MNIKPIGITQNRQQNFGISINYGVNYLAAKKFMTSFINCLSQPQAREVMSAITEAKACTDKIIIDGITSGIALTGQSALRNYDGKVIQNTRPESVSKLVNFLQQFSKLGKPETKVRVSNSAIQTELKKEFALNQPPLPEWKGGL